MSTFMSDIGGLYSESITGIRPTHTTSREKANELSMTDFLNLMIVQLQNQSIDSTTDTSDMLNQMVQMQMIQSITSITDATVMMYAGSLVGKEVTVGQFDNDGNLIERVLTITGTGVSDGEQVLFAGDEMIKLTDVMAVGRLPEIKKDDETGGAGDNKNDQDAVTPPENVELPPKVEETPDDVEQPPKVDETPDDAEQPPEGVG